MKSEILRRQSSQSDGGRNQNQTSMDQIGIGVIGSGGMGMNVVERLLKLDERLRMHAVFDPDERSIEGALKRGHADAKVYDSYEELVQADDIDWVMIASWNCQHAAQTIAAFEAGKHVFCQKPLATNAEDCIAMNDAWKRSGKSFIIGFSLRFAPHYRRIKELLTEGVVGDIISLDFNETLDFCHGGYIMGDWRRLRENAGTHLLEKCCHDIDIVNWIVGSMAVRVASFGGLNFFKAENAYHIDRIGTNDDGKEAFQSWPGLVSLNPFTSDKDIFDNQVAIIEFANEVRASFHANCNAGIGERRMCILGSEGALRADFATGKVEIARIGFDVEIEDQSAEFPDGGHGGADDIVAAELADTMLNGAPPTVGLKDGLKAALTCFAIDDAADTGTVVDVRPYWERAGLQVK